MKLQVLKPSSAGITGLLLTAPALYFIFIAALKYGFSLSGPFDALKPLLLSFGANKPIGWNINLLVLAGPFFAVVFNLFAVTTFGLKWSEEAISFHVALQQKAWNWVAFSLSGACLTVLFVYALGESCRC